MIIKNKRVLVTGGSGMIGRHLVDLLKKEDCKITIADLSEPTGIDDVEYKKVDLTDYKSCVLLAKKFCFSLAVMGTNYQFLEGKSGVKIFFVHSKFKSKRMQNFECKTITWKFFFC